MGRPIARRLLESGVKLTAYDREHGRAEELVIRWHRRTERCGTLLQLQRRLSCLPSDSGPRHLQATRRRVRPRASRLGGHRHETVPGPTSKDSRVLAQRGLEILCDYFGEYSDR